MKYLDERISMIKSIPSIIKNVAQPKRSQAYYDAIAKQLERGMLALVDLPINGFIT